MKFILHAAPAVGLLAACITIATSARAHQLAGTAMSNGKGGTMSPGEGYYLAFVCGVMGLGFLYYAWKAFKAANPKGGAKSSEALSQQ